MGCEKVHHQCHGNSGEMGVFFPWYSYMMFHFSFKNLEGISDRARKHGMA